MFSNRLNPLVTRFTTLTQRHLSDEVVALYLRGSAARDDWVPGLSDVDFFIVVRDGTLENASSRRLFHSNLNPIVEDVNRRWPGETPSLRVVPLSHVSTNPIGSFLTGINAQLLLGSDVLAQVSRPSPLDLSRFGDVEFGRFSSYWVGRVGEGRVSGNLSEEAAYQQYVVLKLAQAALLSKGILETRKETIADAFMKEFADFDLAHVVDKAQRLRLTWPRLPQDDVRNFVQEALPFPQALRNHLVKGQVHP